jgi:subtilisin-like proprotein convertase family protein
MLRTRFSSSVLLGLGVAGVLAAATPVVAQTTFNANPASLGAIPDGGALCPEPGAPRLVTFAVAGKAGPVVSVALSATLAHPWVGDLTATLIAPNGTTSHVLFGRTGLTTEGGGGHLAMLVGAYTFRDTATGNWWTAAQTDPLAPGAYRTSQLGGAGATGAVTAMDPVFAGVEPNGTWTLQLTDGCNFDTGSVTAAAITVTTTGVVASPTAAPDTYGVTAATSLAVAAPGVLLNDANPIGGGTMTAVLVSPPAHGAFTLNADGSFTYTPTAAFSGPDSFTYRPANLGGNGGVTTVTLNVTGPTTIQPATAFRVDDVSGNQVTLRWEPPLLGPSPTGYLVEGGVTPGSTLAILPVGPVPFLRFTAPNGSFFVRVKSLDGGAVSATSNEVPLHVGVPVAPSAPDRLTGLANGSALALSWSLTHEGGAPTDVILDITGAATASLPLGPVESFTLNGVPAGTYTFAVRAANATGASTPSSATTLTFPASCSGAPAAPERFLFFRVGTTVFLFWDPPASGAAPTAYQLTVSGAFNGAVPVGGARTLSSPVPSGSYTVSVTALNACGASAPTAPQTVVVP